MIKLKRVYEPAEKEDGIRILVERLWPRGVSKKEARLDTWMRDIAPSPLLRKWYQHDVNKWPEFRKRYEQELSGKTEQIAKLKKLSAGQTVTFVYAAKDERHNSALVLKEYIET